MFIYFTIGILQRARQSSLFGIKRKNVDDALYYELKTDMNVVRN